MAPEFQSFARHNLRTIPGGQSSPNYPVLLTEIESLEAEVEGEQQQELFHFDFIIPSAETNFPVLFSNREHISMRIEELIEEISLILDMTDADGSSEACTIYSVRAIKPEPFCLSRESQINIAHLPASAVSNARAGFLVHDDLYPLATDPAALRELMFAFLQSCTAVEVKFMTAGDQLWRCMTVNLAP